MTQIPNSLRMLAGEEETRMGVRIFRRGNCVKLAEQTVKEIRLRVYDEVWHEVTFFMNGTSRCSCPVCIETGACRHLVAAMMYCQENGVMDEMIRTRAAESGPKLMAAMDKALPMEGALKMLVILVVVPGGIGEIPRLRVSLKIGEERLYAVKSIPSLLASIDAGTPMEFGKGFTFHPEWMRFGRAENRILAILRALALAQTEAGITLRGPEQQQMLLPIPFAEALLAELCSMPFAIKDGDAVHKLPRVIPATMPLQFRVSASSRGLTVTAQNLRDFRPLTPSCAYALVKERVIAVEEGQRNILRVLYAEQMAGQCSFDYPVREAARVIGELVPFLQMSGVVDIDSELQKQLIRLPLTSKVYLDRAANQRDVIARVEFCYGDRRIDPFNEQPLPENLTRNEKLLLRDAAAERQVLDALGVSGFTASTGYVFLTGQENIFNFVSEGVGHLQQMAEVYLSNEFRRMTPRKPSLLGRMRMSSTGLELKFTESDIPAQEIYAIMEALARKRRYFP